MKRKTKIGILSIVTALVLVLVITVNALALTIFSGLATAYFGTLGGESKEAEGDSIYYPMDFDSASDLYQAETKLNVQIAEEGVVLLKNDGMLPLGKGKTVSLFGTSAVNLVCGGSGSGAGSTELNVDLKTAFNAAGIFVNEPLWNFYKKAVEGDYGIAAGSISFGARFDWSINEVPATLLQAEAGLQDTFVGTTAVYVFSRTGGEDGDLARDMAAYGGNAGEHYLELDETERGVLAYLNENFEDILVIVNTNNAFELDFVEEYEHIHAVIFAPGLGRMGAYGLANVIAGYNDEEEISPSGRLVDTFAYDAFSAPAMQNMGDFRYGDSGYYYVSYSEGIYVGYRYYETRYEDSILGTENVGEFDYDATVAYPFGYGLSYTTFDWTDFALSGPNEQGEITATVTVTNTGSRNGKEVVELYVQSPYTQYDKENGIEKAAVELCGFAKTETLAPREKETVEITFNMEDCKAYDANGAKTYILDAGTYYVTAARDAHNAINNILTKKGYDVEGDGTLVGSFEQETLDTTTYSVDSATGAEITNRFEDAELEDAVYLTRQNWSMMDNNGLRYGEVSTAASPMEQNGVAFVHEISSELRKKLDSTDSLSTDPTTYTDLPLREQDKGLEIIDLRGVDQDDPRWDDLASQLTLDEMRRIVFVNGYSALGAVESVHKPVSQENDGPAGFNDFQYHRAVTTEGDNTTMGWATEMLLGQTYNETLAYEMGRMVGNEAIIIDNAGWYAPAINIHRTPFAGRNFEYFSEDPFLSGIFAHEVVNGAAEKGVICYTKHFALNDQETHRSGVATWAQEQTIREIYLKPFEMTFKDNEISISYTNEEGETAQKTISAALGTMTSFNRIGATWAGGHYNLLTEVLRGEWGFTGLVLTDYNGVQEHMDTVQMLYAGGDTKLRTLDQGFTAGALKRDIKAANLAKESAKRYLYVQAHSLVMNGLTHGTARSAGFPVYQLLLLVLDVLTLVGVAFLVHRIYKLVRQKNGIRVEKA